MTGKYDDIIDLPHHQSVTRPHMSGMDRAAQFSPFAAIVGYDRAVKETARLTEQRMELDADAIEQLNEKLRQLQVANRGTAGGGHHVLCRGPQKAGRRLRDRGRDRQEAAAF